MNLSLANFHCPFAQNNHTKVKNAVINIVTSEDMENMPLGSQLKFRENFMSGLFSSKTLVSI